MVPKMCKNTHFSHFYLHMSEKSSTFAADYKSYNYISSSDFAACMKICTGINGISGINYPSTPTFLPFLPLLPHHFFINLSLYSIIYYVYNTDRLNL